MLVIRMHALLDRVAPAGSGRRQRMEVALRKELQVGRNPYRFPPPPKGALGGRPLFEPRERTPFQPPPYPPPSSLSPQAGADPLELLDALELELRKYPLRDRSLGGDRNPGRSPIETTPDQLTPNRPMYPPPE